MPDAPPVIPFPTPSAATPAVPPAYPARTPGDPGSVRGATAAAATPAVPPAAATQSPQTVGTLKPSYSPPGDPPAINGPATVPPQPNCFAPAGEEIAYGQPHPNCIAPSNACISPPQAWAEYIQKLVRVSYMGVWLVDISANGASQVSHVDIDWFDTEVLLRFPRQAQI